MASWDESFSSNSFDDFKTWTLPLFLSIKIIDKLHYTHVESPIYLYVSFRRPLYMDLAELNHQHKPMYFILFNWNGFSSSILPFLNE